MEDNQTTVHQCCNCSRPADPGTAYSGAFCKQCDEEITEAETYPRPVNSQGLRYVSEEVGWVDEDEEYY